MLDYLAELGGRVDASRVAMMVLDFMLVRTLIYNVLLNARSRNDTVNSNLKILATVIYVLARMLNPDLLEHNAPAVKSKRAFGRGAQKDGGTVTPAVETPAVPAEGEGGMEEEQNDRLMTNADVTAKLLPRDYLDHIKADIEPWLETYRDMIKNWLVKVVEEIVKRSLPKA